MDAPRLDRLTALLEGLSPKVTLATKPDGFSLHIIKTGTSDHPTDSFSGIQQDALSLLVCPGFVAQTSPIALVTSAHE